MKIFLSVLLAAFVLPAVSQNAEVKMTDSNTALHALSPDYPVPLFLHHRINFR